MPCGSTAYTSNGTSVIKQIRLKKILTGCLNAFDCLPFKITQGHHNRHESIIYLSFSY